MNFGTCVDSVARASCYILYICRNVGRAGIVEHNGDVYSCDHYMYPDYRIGNIYQDPFAEMMDSEQQRQFGENKKKSLPQYLSNM